jgi:hypothetical protein
VLCLILGGLCTPGLSFLEQEIADLGHLETYYRCMAASGSPKTWKPTRQNHIVVADMTVMHGGPVGMCLPEHEHPEIQVGMHFFSAKLSGKHQLIGEVPNYFSLIPCGKPHKGAGGTGPRWL